jgi:large subunit ribosomal protein L30
MASIKITQVRSVIDRPKRQKDTMKALGINKMHQTVVKEVNPQIMGMVAKVRHLITLEEI